MEQSIYRLVEKAKTGDTPSQLALLQRFEPLLKASAYYVGVDDAYNDLLLSLLSVVLKHDFSNMICKDDSAMVAYISNSIHRDAIRMKKKWANRNKNEKFTEDLTDSEQIIYENICSTVESYPVHDIEMLKACLSKSEFHVLYCFYFLDQSIAQIAGRQHKSRQAVNATKIRALKKLKKYIEQSHI